jgi:hypothetical protein
MSKDTPAPVEHCYVVIGTCVHVMRIGDNQINLKVVTDSSLNNKQLNFFNVKYNQIISIGNNFIEHYMSKDSKLPIDISALSEVTNLYV